MDETDAAPAGEVEEEGGPGELQGDGCCVPRRPGLSFSAILASVDRGGLT